MQICMHTGMALARETRGLPKLGCTPSQEQSLLLSWRALFSVHAYRSSPGRQFPIKPPLNVGLYLLDRKYIFNVCFYAWGRSLFLKTMKLDDVIEEPYVQFKVRDCLRAGGSSLL